MMAICCGLPVVGFLVIGGMGISSPSLETLLILACPIGMGYMMYMMRKKHGAQEQSCCSSEGETQESLETGSQSENPVKAVNSLPAESTVSVKTS